MPQKRRKIPPNQPLPGPSRPPGPQGETRQGRGLCPGEAQPGHRGAGGDRRLLACCESMSCQSSARCRWWMLEPGMCLESLTRSLTAVQTHRETAATRTGTRFWLSGRSSVRRRCCREATKLQSLAKRKSTNHTRVWCACALRFTTAHERQAIRHRCRS